MTYLVTGTSSGIGRAVALRLAERGHDVIAGVRRASDAPAHSRIRPVTLDITDAAQLAAAAKDAGQLSGLVNSAGVTFAGPVEHLPLDRLREQLEVNVVGLVAATQAFLPAIRAGRGRVVMIGSTAVASPRLSSAPTAPRSSLWKRSRTRCARNWRLGGARHRHRTGEFQVAEPGQHRSGRRGRPRRHGQERGTPVRAGHGRFHAVQPEGGSQCG
jgi:NAD(P)-dependent dehydrogenase (short-subunit alcohol dehydrogenase family)